METHVCHIFLSYNRGGYCVHPRVIEFWQGQSNRLHDRIEFRKCRTEDLVNSQSSNTSHCWKDGEDGWIFSRLSP